MANFIFMETKVVWLGACKFEFYIVKIRKLFWNDHV